jgi:toxin-antitoxin system PIN domain toxin
MSYLLDVNVLLALCWEEVELHAAARAWFGRHAAKTGWATTPLTESGFLRLSMNPRLFPVPASFREALGILDALRATPGHRFLEGAPMEGKDLPVGRIQGYRQVVDATLLSTARRHGCQLATFDRGIASLATEPEWKKVLALVG